MRKCIVRTVGRGQTIPAIVMLLWTLLMMTSDSHVLCHVPRMNLRMNWSSTVVVILFFLPGCRSVPTKRVGRSTYTHVHMLTHTLTHSPSLPLLTPPILMYSYNSPMLTPSPAHCIYTTHHYPSSKFNFCVVMGKENG